MAMSELEIATEMYTMLSALDNALASVFKEHTAVPGEAVEQSTYNLQLTNLDIMRNLARTMEKLQGMNPMALMKLMLGV